MASRKAHTERARRTRVESGPDVAEVGVESGDSLFTEKEVKSYFACSICLNPKTYNFSRYHINLFY